MKPRRSHRLLYTLLLLCTGFTYLVPVTVAQPANDPSALWGETTLYRDEWGVPHIYARNVRAMAFAFGYAQAEDHLEEMLLAYRVASGRAAAVLGEAYAGSDVFALTVGHRRLAEEALNNVDALTIDLCEGFALGVNAWLYDHADTAPPWAEGVAPADILALWHSFMVSMAPLDLPTDYQRPIAAHTGNAWALAANRTKDNVPYLVINPHQYHNGPFRWYEAHLNVGDMNIAGATLFGLPVILQGHTPTHGWALTPNFADFADVFSEPTAVQQRNPNSINKKTDPLEAVLPLLEYYAQSQPYYVLTESGLEQRITPSHITPGGPLLDQNGFYTWRIGGFNAFGALSQCIAMARAQNLEAFQTALTLQQIPAFHITYADKANNLFYLYNATTGTHDITNLAADNQGNLTPILKDFKSPLPRRYMSQAWGENVPATGLPHLINPSSGFIQACGNPPWAVTEPSSLSADGWPDWFVSDPDTHRAKRARQLLRNGTLSFNDMQSMLYDVVAPGALFATRKFIAMVEQANPPLENIHPDLPKGINLLSTWNYLAETNNPGMTFFHVWWNALRNRTSDTFTNDAQIYAAFNDNAPAFYETAMLAAGDAARIMRNDLNAIEVPWGDVHKIQRGARVEALPGSTSGEPLFVAADTTYVDGTLIADYGYGFAMAVRFDETPYAVSMVPFGASENPASPHYDDQLDLMLEKRFKVTRFTEAAVRRYAQDVRGKDLELRPLGAEGRIRCTSTLPIRARLKTHQTPPGPLPEDLSAFSLFIQLEAAHGDHPIEVKVDLGVPETLCLPKDQAQLRLYRYSSTDGWVALDPVSEAIPSTFIRGQHDNDGYFAVLGPSAILIEAPDEGTPKEDPANAPTVPKPAE